MLTNHSFKILSITVIMGIFALVWGIVFFSILQSKHKVQFSNISLATPTTQNTLSSHSLTPIISNQWYSSLFTSFPSSPLYALPLVFKTTSEGLGFSFPTITKTKDTISAPYTQDFTIGYSIPFSKTEVTNIGDWTLSARLLTADQSPFSFTIGHGIPFAIIRPTAEVVTTPSHTFTITINNKIMNNKSFITDNFMLTTNNNLYIFSFPKQILIQQNNKQITFEKTDKIFVGLLDKKEHYNLFKQNSNIDITDSQSSFHVNDNLLHVTYSLTTENGVPLITLYPHQSDLYPAKKDILGTYQTIRGPLQLIKADSFFLTTPLTIPNGNFKKLSNDYPDLTKQIKTDIQTVLSSKPPTSQDYYLGTWFGKISTLLLLADTYGMEKEKKQLLDYVEPTFLKSLDYFSYDKAKTSIIATKPEFGNEQLNDHHFHYGYYIRTAAVISSFDLPFLPKVKEKINAMVSDIATFERGSSSYPYIRNFDVYEGHSWADGLGDTNDGNNQESSSEAINAWYGVYLWGKIINDSDLQKNALSLYNIEIQSAYYYWLNKTNIYGAPYTHAIASIIWGGKVDFATWFSKDTNMIYGIQLLPITPASMYLGALPTFAKYKEDFLTSNGNVTKDWGDLFTIWESFYNPAEALKVKSTVTKPETNTPKSVFLYMLYYNQENNSTVTPSVSPTQ